MGDTDLRADIAGNCLLSLLYMLLLYRRPVPGTVRGVRCTWYSINTNDLAPVRLRELYVRNHTS